ncbi:MAG: ParB N-terminal domain-containing protein [Alphaproteobacteria bacterium]|nr:ParB N-terminal domain-containing protein [Alphaproteobacteria bacterium]
MKETLQLQHVDIESIKPYPLNPKEHEEKQTQQIAKSIERFGFNTPILVDTNSEIIAGHGRFKAAKLLGLKQIPVIFLSHLNEAEKKAYRLADNKLSENGKWNTDLLKLEFVEIEKLALNFEEELNLDITGFDLPEIDVLMQETSSSEAIDEKLNTPPFVPDDEIISKQGDIWNLGKHRIICGDSLQKETLDKLCGSVRADMVFSDPPCNVCVKNIVEQGKTKHKEFAFASGEMNENEFINFLQQSMQNMADFSKDGSVHYLCMDWRHIYEMLSASRPVYEKMLNLVVWCKQNGGMGSFYRSQHELIFVFQKRKGSHTNNVELGKHGRYRTNVWHCAGVNSFGKNQSDLKMHPTVKPVELVEEAILDASKRRQIVFDAFLGSGSTLIAAEKTGRICYGVEYEPRYIDTIIRRFHKLTGIWATHELSGKNYEQLLTEKKEKENVRL